jgi:hypothetical protein
MGLNPPHGLKERGMLLGDGARKDWWRVVGAGAVSPYAW